MILDDDNDKSTTSTTKDCSNTIPNSDIIYTNDRATRTNNTTDKFIDPIDTTNLLECMDNDSFDNDFMEFIDEGSVVDSSTVDEDTENYASPEPVQTQLIHSSRVGTPESISFVNNNDELSIESLQLTNNSISYSQTSHKSKYTNGKIEKN